jgi:hypothetical protein
VSEEKSNGHNAVTAEMVAILTKIHAEQQKTNATLEAFKDETRGELLDIRGAVVGLTDRVDKLADRVDKLTDRVDAIALDIHRIGDVAPGPVSASRPSAGR